MWPTLFRRTPGPAYRRERVELPDGDFLDLDHAGTGPGPGVLVLHGLEGSSRSPYVRGLVGSLVANGWRATVMNFRGCSGEPNRLARSYHSGEIRDLTHVVAHLRARDAAACVAVVGFSLGGNVLVKWLAARGSDAPVRAAVAVCVPLDLGIVADRLTRGFSRVYQWWLLGGLRRKAVRKLALHGCTIAPPASGDWWTFRSFDDAVTAPLHGFAGVDDYYRRASSRSDLVRIRRPTLLIQADDDPFTGREVLPATSECSTDVVLEISRGGGHVGFVAGPAPWRARYWLDERILGFLRQNASDAPPAPS